MTNEPRPSLVFDFVSAGAIFTLALLVFWFSPVKQVTDSHYSMMLSESLLKHRSFQLDHFNLPRLEPNVSTRDYYEMNGNIWQLELAHDHIYYYFPPGSSVLSVPVVAIANALGISPVNADGTYNPQGEIRIESSLAAILMALLAVLFYCTSRLLLPIGWSIAIALAGSLGTQIWSTASRGLWSHTWETLLAGLLVFLLVRSEVSRQKLNLVLLATVLAWMYFVRPNAIVVIVTVTVYLLLQPRRLTKYLLTGVLWLAGFVLYSWIHFGKVLPSYYQANRLRLDLFPVAFAGNLISPSRGLLLYVPLVLFIGYLLIRYRKNLELPKLFWLSVAIIALHLLVVSTFANLWGDWWGGASFGPRYTTELVPWLMLLSIISIKAWTSNSLRWVELIAGALLCAASIFINARGALSAETWKWSQPSTDQQLRASLWDWRHPQFLAGLQTPALPVEFPRIELPVRIDFRTPESEKFLWYGWSGAEPGFRWTDGKRVAVVFSLSDTSKDVALELRLGPYLAAPQLKEQRLTVGLNGQPVQTFMLSEGEIRDYSTLLPKARLSKNNVLTFELPDATSPAALAGGDDERLLGIRVEWLRISAARRD